jgi:hypothetical protein
LKSTGSVAAWSRNAIVSVDDRWKIWPISTRSVVDAALAVEHAAGPS